MIIRPHLYDYHRYSGRYDKIRYSIDLWSIMVQNSYFLVATLKSVAEGVLDIAVSAPEVPSWDWMVMLTSFYPFLVNMKLRNSKVTLRARNFSDPM